MCVKAIKQSSMIRPAAETPKRTLWLSRLDMIVRMPLSHSAALFVYNPSIKNDEKNDEPTNNNICFDITILKESLSKVLVPFYPMAGRLKEDDNGRIEIDCNGEGVLFVEVETTHSLLDFGDFEPTPEMRKLLIPSCDYSKGLESFPLVMVQLTRFKCGGVTLGFAQHHDVADGSGHVHFINSWARLARGLDLELMPIHERTPYLSPRNPPQANFQHLEYTPSQGLSLGDSELNANLEKDAAMTAVFKFTGDQVSALKQKASVLEVNYKLSTYEVLAGHIWRSACKARGVADDQEVRLYIPTNGRYRLKNPALPQGFCGNATFFLACIAKSGDVTRNPLSYAAGKIHDTLGRMNDEDYLRSSIDYLETYPNFEALIRGQHSVSCPNMSINSWARIPLHKADFGWGSPSCVRHGGISWEGQSFLVPSFSGDGGFSLSIRLLAHHMALFRKCLYDI